ncbi:hypothetical protein GM547_13775 [Streptococcus pneumoniae]|nr:hypothetical protein [Streptococcus pneumoniae]
MDRAIAAAQRRGDFASKKAGSIRGGTYLTEGVPQTPDVGGGGSWSIQKVN